MTFRETIRMFLLAKKGELLSGNTIEYYDRWIKDFSKYAVSKGAFDWYGVNDKVIQAYFSDLKESRGYRTITINDAYRAIRAWVRYLYKQNAIPSNPIEGIKPPKVAKKIPRTFTAKEIKAMFDSVEKNSFVGKRDYMILATLLGTGIRKSELAGLKTKDVDTENGYMKVLGKGNKERYIPISRKLRQLIRKYLNIREIRGFDSAYFFVNRYGERLRPNTLNSIFKRIKERSGVEGERVSCHTWRHTFAKSYLRNGGDVFSLQKILGHEDLATTKLYLNLNLDEVQEQYNKYNPLENKDWTL